MARTVFHRALILSCLIVLPLASAGSATAPTDDLFAFAAGTQIIDYPEDSPLTAMDSSPLNLIDGSAATDWTGAAGQPVTFVLELAETTELSRLSFDTGGLNRNEKAPGDIRVEVSTTSADAGFAPALSARLRMNANNQSFAFPADHRPTARWVRLTLLNNHGDDYSGLTGFHGYGRQLTQTAHLPDINGRYDGASGIGTMNLTRSGDAVSGCYEYQSSQLTGVVDGRVVHIDVRESGSDGSTRRTRGTMTFGPDGRLYGLVRNVEGFAQDAYAEYFSADRVSRNPSRCS